jgi:hypothetical protein
VLKEDQSTQHSALHLLVKRKVAAVGAELKRPIRALTPFEYIGKEIERSAQEGEDISLIETDGPVRYGPRLKGKTHAADARLILRAKQFPFRMLMREADVSQHALERFLSGARVYPATRAKLAQAIDKLERTGALR